MTRRPILPPQVLTWGTTCVHDGDMTNAPHILMDYDTTNEIGPATDEQIEASNAADDNGAILIDTESGDVVTDGSWAALDARRRGTLRTVYTMPA